MDAKHTKNKTSESFVTTKLLQKSHSSKKRGLQHSAHQKAAQRTQHNKNQKQEAKDDKPTQPQC